MKLEDCKKCKNFLELRNYQVQCTYGGAMNSMATTLDEKSGEYIILACPLEKK